MAIYHFRQTVISGGSGHSAVAAAAYRHNAVMQSDKVGQSEDYSRRQGTVHSELAIPADSPAWVLRDFGFAASTQTDETRLTGDGRVRQLGGNWV